MLLTRCTCFHLFLYLDTYYVYIYVMHQHTETNSLDVKTFMAINLILLVILYYVILRCF